MPAAEGGTTAALSFANTAAASNIRYLTDYPGVLGTNARTVMAWIKAAISQPDTGPTIVGYGANSTANRYTLRLNSDGRLRIECSGVVGLASSASPDLRDNAWHHVAVTLPANGRGSNFVLYVDGAVTPQAVPTGGGTLLNTLAGGLTVGIGGSSHAANYDFNGSIDDVRIYDHDLTPAEIAAIVFGPGTPLRFQCRQPRNR